MMFKNNNAEFFIPDNVTEEKSLQRTTHMGIGAHSDDLEIMAYHGILAGFGSEKNWFLGVTVTDGSGSPRDGLYANYTDESMQKVRKIESKKAAMVGEYSGIVLLDYPSSAVKDPNNKNVKEEIKKLIIAARPSVIYTHNLADKHDTHVAVSLLTIKALRELPKDNSPQNFYGCEVWRDLDWVVDKDKVVLDVSGHENLESSLLGVFDSQTSGGKRYDLATIGRRRANATYSDTHGIDIHTGSIFAMDLMPLIENRDLDIEQYIKEHIDRFAVETLDRIRKIAYRKNDYTIDR